MRGRGILGGIVGAILGCGCTSSMSAGSGGSSSGSSTSQGSTVTTAVSVASSSTGGVDPAESCPGEAVAFALDTPVVIDASTTAATDDEKESCGDVDASTSAADRVFELTIPSACTFSATLDSSFDGVLALRSAACDTESPGDVCANASGAGESILTELEPGTYWLVVDGAGPAELGPATLDLACSTPACGDGVVNAPSEECDPGAPAMGVLCGAVGSANACKIESADAADTCSDIASGVSIGAGQTIYLPPSTPLFSSLDGADDAESTMCGTPGSGAPDQVFEVLPAASGMLTISIGFDAGGRPYCQPPYDQPECFVSVMWVRSPDCDAGPEIACDTGGAYDLVVPVLAGAPYFVFVEGSSANPAVGENGEYLLRMSLN